MKAESRSIPLDLPVVTPIQVARACYLKWKATPTFEYDLCNYLETGIVISRPDIFAMARVIEEREPVLFVRVAVGSLRTLLSSLPVLTPWIRFYRRNGTRARTYPLARLLDTTGKIIKRREV